MTLYLFSGRLQAGMWDDPEGSHWMAPTWERPVKEEDGAEARDDLTQDLSGGLSLLPAPPSPQQQQWQSPQPQNAASISSSVHAAALASAPSAPSLSAAAAPSVAADDAAGSVADALGGSGLELVAREREGLSADQREEAADSKLLPGLQQEGPVLQGSPKDDESIPAEGGRPAKVLAAAALMVPSSSSGSSSPGNGGRVSLESEDEEEAQRSAPSAAPPFLAAGGDRGGWPELHSRLAASRELASRAPECAAADLDGVLTLLRGYVRAHVVAAAGLSSEQPL